MIWLGLRPISFRDLISFLPGDHGWETGKTDGSEPREERTEALDGLI